MDFGDWWMIIEALAISITWAVVLKKQPLFIARREKLGLAALVCVSAFVAFDGILTIIMHSHSQDDLGAKAFLIIVPTMSLFGLAGLFLALIGKGASRVAALVWCAFILCSTAGVFFAAMGIDVNVF